MSLSTPSDRHLPPESDHPTIFLPNASFLLYGEFERVGFDLVITNPAGEKFVVEDYFAFQPPPTLMIASGAGLSPEMVMALMPDQFAGTMYAGPAASGGVLEQIGTVRFASGDVEVTDRNGDVRTVGRGDPVYKGDRIETGDRSFIRIRMEDGTRFNLGKNAEATLDDFQYDEASRTGKFEAMVRVGGFHYKSGGIGKLNPNARHSTIKTPSAFIGIRGSELEGTVDNNGETIVVHRSGVLEITDINGQNAVELTTPGNTSVVVLGGSPGFFSQPTTQQTQALQQDLPPPDPTEDDVEDEPEEAEEETGETEAETVAEETGEEETEEAEEAAEEVVDEEAVEEEAEEEDAEEDEETDDDDVDEEAEAETEAESDEEVQDETDAGPEAEVEAAPEAEPTTAEGEPSGDGTADTASGESTTESATGDDVMSQQPSEAELSDVTVIESGTADAAGDTGTTDSGTSGSGTSSDTSVTNEPVATTEPTTEQKPEPETQLPPDNPPIANPDTASLQAGESIDLSTLVLSNDEDPDENQSPSLSGVVTNGVLGTASLSNGVLTYTADRADSLGEGETAVDTFTYQVASGGLLDSAQVQVTVTGVNDAPLAVDDTAFTDENTSITIGNLLANDVDPDVSDTLAVTSIDTAGTVGLLTDNGDGTYTYDPNGQFDILTNGGSATDSFTYTVSDGSGITSTATVTVIVSGTNLLPLAVDDTATTDENTVVTTGNVLVNDSDPDADPLTVLAVDLTGTTGGVTNNGDGTFTYSPNGQFAHLAAGESATDSFSYAVSDGAGGTATASVTVTILGVNNGPVAVNDIVTANEDTAVVTANVLINDTDADASDVLSVSSVNTTGTLGLVTNNGDGTFTYDPNGQFTSLGTGASATDSFIYTVSDSNGGTATASVTVTITGGNDVPVAVADTASVSEDLTVVTGNVLANDTDADGDALTVLSVNTTGTLGLVTNNLDGTFTYNPNGQFDALGVGATAADSFIYTVSDGNGGTATATVTVTINGANDAPVALADTGITDENTALMGNLLLANDTDADGDVLAVLSVNTTGTLGLVTNNLDGTFTYNPNGQFEALGAGATAADSFIYTVSDGNGGTATASVTVTITGSNDVPLAVADTAIVDENLTVVTGNVLANDIDADGDVLTVLSVDTTGTLGLVTNNLDGTFTYNPNGQFEALAAGTTATDGFSYTVSDGNGGTAIATVTVTINGTNDAPLATADSYSAIAGQTSTLAVLLNDTDADGDVLTVTTTALSELAGSLTVNPDGTITYTPNPLFVDMDAGETFADAFVYTVTDPSGAAATATVTVNVGLDPAYPQPAEDFFSAAPLTAFVTGNVLANDTGGTGALTILDFDGQTSNGSEVVYNGDGTFTVFLGPQVFHDFDGTAYLDENPREEYFDYVVVDGASQTNDAEVILDVGDLSAVTRTEINTNTETTITDTNSLFVNNAWLTIIGTSSITGFLANLGQLELVTSTLTVDGGIGSYGPLHVSSGSTLKLTAGLFGASWIDGGGTIDVSTAAFVGEGGMAPGASIGTLTIIGNTDPNTVQLSSHHHLEIEISSTGTDLLSVNGAADLDGNVTVRDIGAFPIAGESRTIITTTLGYTGEIRNFELPVLNGLVIDPVQNGSTVVLNFDYPTNSPGILTPTAGVDAILGSTGSDIFDLSANAAGDKFYGDLGSDVFIISDLGFARIDGGGDGSVDYDTLRFTSPSIDLRGVTAYQIDSIDVLDMADGSAGTLTLDVDSALNISSVLFIPADVGDHIILHADDGWASRDVFIEDHPFEELFVIGGQNSNGDNVDLLVSVNATAEIIEANGESLFLGSGGNDTLTGTANHERFIGRAGDDQILAGAGEDEVVYDAADVTLVDGGADFDVLIPGRAPGASIDLTTTNPYINFESIDLGEGWDSNTLIIDLANVAQTGQLNMIFGDGTNQLIIEGTIDDYVILNGLNLRDGILPGGVTASTDARFPEYTKLTDGTNTVLVENELFGPGVNHKPIAQPDSVTTISNQAIILDPLANDLDADPGDTFTLTAIPAITEAGVPLVDNGNGTWTYDPTGYFGFLAPGQTASDFFQYTIADNSGVTSTGYVDITIESDPNAVIAASDADATDEATILVTVDVRANDQNAVEVVEFDRKSWWGADIKYNGPGTGTFTYDPDHQFDYLTTGQTATDRFSYTVTDGLGNTSTGFVDLVINGSSTHPVTNTNSSTTTITTVTDLTSDLYVNDGFLLFGTGGNVIGGTLVNNNELTLSAGGDLTVGQGLDNEGYVMLNGGTLFVERSDFDNYWDVSGTGTIDLSAVSTDTFGNTLAQPIFENEGLVYPGGFSATGTLSIVGDASFHRGGEVYIEVNDTTATTTFDLLETTGNMELGGHLDVYPMAGFVPLAGQIYTPVTAGSIAGEIVGEFHSIAGLDHNNLGGGFVLDVTYNLADVTLTVVPVDIFGSTATTTVTATAPGQVLVGSTITHTETFDLTGNTTDAIVYGRGGNDTFLVDDFTFRRIDGGPGFDEVRVASGDLNLLASHYQLDGVEVINLRDLAPTVLTTDRDTLSLAADRDGQLNLLGDAGDEHFVTTEYVSWIDEPGIDHTDTQGNSYFTYFLYDRDFQEPVTVNVSTDVATIIESPFETIWYGSAGPDTFNDANGDFNIFIGHGGNDIANLGAGFDEIVYDPLNATGNIDGGADEDRLVPFYGGLIDLTAANPYVSVETIELEFRGPNSVKLDMADVAQMGALDQFIADGTTQVRLIGDADDRVMLEGVLIHEFSPDLSLLGGMGITLNTAPLNIFGQNFITLTDGANTLYVSEDIYYGVGNLAPEIVNNVQAVSAAYTTADTFTVDLLATAFDGNRDSLTVQGLSLLGGDASGILNNGDGTLTVDPSWPAYVNTSTTTVTYQYTVADGFGGTTTTSHTATITLGGLVNQFVSGTDYGTSINWSSGLVPTSTDTVLIDTTTTARVTFFGEAGSLELDDGANMQLGFTGTSTTNTFTVGNLVMEPGSWIGIHGPNSALSVANNARFAGSSFFSGDGIVEFSGAGANINLPDGYYLDVVPWVLSAGVDISGGYFEIGSTGELRHENGFAVINTDGFANSGNLLVAPTVVASAPWMHVHGDMDNYGVIRLDNLVSGGGSESVTLDVFGGTLFNYGTISSQDIGASGGIRTLRGNVDNYGTIDVQYSLLIDPDGGKFYNADLATITVAGGQTLTFGGGGGEVFNYGTIDATAGLTDTLDASTVYFQNEGTIQGFLNVFGLDVNNGVLDPGASPGLMNIHGDYNETAGSTLEIELEGYQPGTGYDQVIVHGAANINGRLNVTLLNGFMPAIASGFAILLADSLTGSFAQASGLDISTSQVLDLSYVNNNVELVTVAVTEAGGTGADVLAGTTGRDVVVAGDGDDMIGNVGNLDIVYGQAGDDTIEITGDFKRVDGGDGVDTLALTDTVDLGNMQPIAIDNIEVIDLQNVRQDVLSLDAEAIKGMVDGHNELAGMDNALVLVGESGDVLQLHGDFVAAGEMSLVLDGAEMSFRIFTEGDTSVLVSDALGLEIYHTDGTVDTLLADSMLTDSIDLSGLDTLVSGEQIGTSTSDTGSLAMADLLDGGNTLDGLLGSDGTTSVDSGSGWTEPYAPSTGDALGSLVPMDSYSFDV